MSSGSPVTRPCAKLPIGVRGARRRRVRGLHPIGETAVDRHVPVARQIEEARREIGIAGVERGFDLALGDGGVE